MNQTKLHELSQLGQSIWLDNINRALLDSGKLKNLIAQGLRGQTSNPTIFKQAIASSCDYDGKITQLAQEGKSIFEIYDELTIKDVQDACDHFLEVYRATNKLDGYVSLEINPKIANEVESQIKEGIRLFQKVNRPNCMIKVPATKAGCRVFEELIANQINVNVTLIFSAEQYQEVGWSYLKGLNRLAQKTDDLSGVHAVASVFVSRVDTTVDKILDEKLAQAQSFILKKDFASLKGKAAVANCEIIYHKFQMLFEGEQFLSLQSKKPNIQRVLWASTGTKNPQYSDVKYVDELIAKNTVNTLPDKTLEAVLDYGRTQMAMPRDVANSQKILEQLRFLGIDVNIICLKLLQEGIAAFEQSFDELMTAIDAKAKACLVSK